MKRLPLPHTASAWGMGRALFAGAAALLALTAVVLSRTLAERPLLFEPLRTAHQPAVVESILPARSFSARPRNPQP